jgi:hypothetical protein
MAAPKKRSDAQSSGRAWSGGTVKPKRGPTLAQSEAAPAWPSPARSLQDELAERVAWEGAPKWSRRRTFLFVVGVCGAFWSAVGALALAAIH